MKYSGPDEIERHSFEIIQSELPRSLDSVLAPVIMRVIHTTADFEYVDTLAFSDGVIKNAVTALRQGISIVSDTNMVKAGVDKTRLKGFGGEIHCFMQDDDVAEAARRNGTTRAIAAIDKAAAMDKNVVESKEALMRSGIPYITAIKRKGGSSVAAAICNALLRIAEGEEVNDEK